MKCGDGLGDKVHNALETIGVTPEVVAQWLNRPCHCDEHRKRLNQLGYWAERVLSGAVDKAQHYLQQIINPRE